MLNKQKSEFMKELWKNPEYKEKMIKVRNEQWTEESRKKLSKSQTGRKHSEETKRKISLKGMGHKVSEEARQRIGFANSISQKGKILSEETIQKMMGRIPWNKNKTGVYSEQTIQKMSGKKHSEEVIQKMRIAHLGLKESEKTKEKQSLSHLEYFKTHTGTMLGKTHSEETIQKMRNHVFSEEHKQRIRIARFEYIKNNEGISYPNLGRYEKRILDELENRIGYKIIRQFYINGYFLDGYCQELNLAIEVDEEHHYKNGELKKKDIEKQESIIKTLNCGFLRLKVSDIVIEEKININEGLYGFK